MIPILWRYTIRAYLKIFLLSVGTFVSVLMVSRFKEVARFAALSSNGGKTALFAVYQIPFILPMAIPLSALIASLLLFQQLSRTNELTALRSLGFPFKNILTPLLLLSSFLALLNFSIAAELAPYCRRESKMLLYRETSGNPLLLLQRQNLIKMKNAYIRIKTKENGTRAHDFTLITYNENNQRLNLMSAKKLKIQGDELLGEDVAIVSYIHSNPGNYDPLIIENQGFLSTDAPLLSAALKKNRPRIDSSSLGLRMLRHRLQEKSKLMKSASIEIFRRLSLSLSVFSFTFLGCAFGIELGRSPKKRTLLYALILAFLILSSYFLGKSFKKELFLAAIVFPLPHLVAIVASILRLFRLSRGVA
jgi:lipopolysaccharide export system permease protein